MQPGQVWIHYVTQFGSDKIPSLPKERDFKRVQPHPAQESLTEMIVLASVLKCSNCVKD